MSQEKKELLEERHVSSLFSNRTNKLVVSKRHLRRLVRNNICKSYTHGSTKSTSTDLKLSSQICSVKHQNKFNVQLCNHLDPAKNIPSANCYSIAVASSVDDTYCERRRFSPPQKSTQEINSFTSDFTLNNELPFLDTHENPAHERPNNTFVNDIRNWILQYRTLLSQQAINDLLQILRQGGYNLPKNARTLLQTPRPCNIIDVLEGHYYHFGVARGILNNLTDVQTVKENDILKLSLNIDGLPLTKSSTSQFWPILLSIESRLSPPFICGIYHGMKKPSDVSQFLNEFVQEFKFLELNGLEVGKTKIFPRISKIICDAPAKAFILGVKGHTGYHGCTKCIDQGEYINGRVTFQSLVSPLRTDDSFKNKEDDDFHLYNSPLENLNVGLVSNVCLDYMHLVCLGVMKRLVLFWVKGKKDVRIPDSKMAILSKNILKLKKVIPIEFARTPRSLLEVDRFKATEFRQLLLYTGPIILKDVLPRDKFLHFMSLHTAIRFLCSPELYLKYNNSACDLLRYFVKNFGALYGKEFVSYNVHNLIHLPNDCLLHGNLDEFSAFKCENYLYNIKKMVKTSRRPLQQIVCRLTERLQLNEKTGVSYPQLEYEVENQLNENITCFKKLKLKNFQIIINDKDNFVLLSDNSIFCVKYIAKNFNNNIFLYGKK
ncbi:uncharacterized protein LOC135134131 [Zophobas morio]|uniref:uncharacterized protein LOC135134131 n=1 Tax=Zophobas morio TaxID=2755281 RepID=UPI00308286A6